jgi:Rad3-related DNA helicase
MSSTILKYFPNGSFPREYQAEALLEIEKHWQGTDVFVLNMPTGTGKTYTGATIAMWNQSTSIITPTNLLVSQYVQEVPSLNKLYKAEKYDCDLDPKHTTCADTKKACKKYCKGCPYLRDLRTAQWVQNKPGVYNYYMYMANELFRKTLVADEAHGLIKTIQDLAGERYWQHDLKYPGSIRTRSDIIHWLQDTGKHESYPELYSELLSTQPKFVIELGWDLYNGKGTRKGEPERRPLIRMHPVDISNAPKYFWPGKVRKLVFMSATINYKDIQALGLDKRIVRYINVKSPIEPFRRRVIRDYVGSLNYQNTEKMLPFVVDKIGSVIKMFPNQKGLLHAPYSFAEKLRGTELSRDPRFMWHTKENVMKVYKEFKALPASSGKILVASGLTEGIDLPMDEARFQIIAKAPWLSLSDPAIRWKADQDPEWYIWNSLKDTIQACGRVCRGPADEGPTYILDGSFERMITSYPNLVPDWFRESLLAGDTYKNES